MGEYWATGVWNDTTRAVHLPAVTTGGHLLHFSYTPTAWRRWAMTDVTARTGVGVRYCASGSLANRIWGVTPSGDLVLFSADATSDDWGVVNISGITGAKVDGPLVWWPSWDEGELSDNIAATSQ